MPNVIIKTTIWIIVITVTLQVQLISKEILYSTDFNQAADIRQWQTVDNGTNNAPSDWQLHEGAYVQLSNIHGGSHQGGTYSVTGKNDWSNYVFEVDYRSTDDDVMGFLFCYHDEENYYRLRLIGSGMKGILGTVLEKVVDGNWKTLASNDVKFADDNWHSIKIIASNGRIIVYQDDMGMPIFSVQDSSHTGGKIGLYSWGNTGSWFDAITVYTVSLVAGFAHSSKIIPLNKPVTLSLNIQNLDEKEVLCKFKVNAAVKVLNNIQEVTIAGNSSKMVSIQIKGMKLQKGSIQIVTEEGVIVTEREMFVVKEEDAGLIPVFGDFHIHTTYSDGKDTPAEMIIAAKKTGLDVIAITDHMTTKGAKAGQVFVEKYSPHLIILNAEENHLIIENTHILAYDLSSKMNSIRDDCPDDVKDNPEKKARWALSQGMVLFQAHPLWEGHDGTEKSKLATLQYLLDEHLVHGFEYRATTNKKSGMYKFYHGHLGKGTVYPILSNSDAHSVDALGVGRTVILTRSYNRDSILMAMKDGKMVVISKSGETIQGPSELVEMARYMLEDFLPIHDAYAIEEAELLRLIHGGHEEKRADLQAMQQKWEELYNLFFPVL